MDPLAGSSWSRPSTIAGFSQSPPNETLMAFAAAERRAGTRPVALDIGCGAARNAVPLAESGWKVVGTDLSWPMLQAALARMSHEVPDAHVQFALAPMDRLPLASAAVDLVIAHGIWNLAKSAVEFRSAVREAARVARPGAGLFLFTFSRTTLPADAAAIAGEPFVFTQFSGQPQCFLTATQLISELAAAGFEADETVPLREINVPKPGTLRAGGPPVIWEGSFRRRR